MSDGLTVQLEIPVRWDAQPGTTVDGAVWLRILEWLELPAGHFDEDHSSEHLRWQALEARVDMCLLLLGQWLAREQPLPPPCALSLSAQGAHWQQPVACAVGQTGYVHLYLYPALPQVLALPARVVACVATAAGWQVEATFDPLPDAWQEGLQRTLFRYHRRAISRQRCP